MSMEQEAQRIEAFLHRAEEGEVHLTEQQIHNLENQAKYLHEHAGHESAHNKMALIIIVTLISFQFVLLWWKKNHYRSYQGVTTIGLWLLPFAFAVHSNSKRFTGFWVLFTILNSWIIFKSTRKPLNHMTPKIVYKWFWVVYQASYITGIIGYFMLFFTFMGFGAPSDDGESKGLVYWGVTLLSYGVYYGILGRDFVEFCTESMASTLGYYTKEGFPRKHLRLGVCAICGVHVSNAISTVDEHGNLQAPVVVQPSAMSPNGTPAVEPSIKLGCGHEFHEECIRGWCLIGKKDICPYCKEKVDLRAFKTNPWDTTQQLYLSLLDALRYLIVWQPVIMGLVHFGFYMTGLQ